MKEHKSKKTIPVVITGPSGVGKTTIIKRLLKEIPNSKLSVSITTRKQREKEIDGIDYYFKTEEEFNKLFDNGEFVETGSFIDNKYGTLKSEIEDNEFDFVFIDIELSGVIQISKVIEDILIIVIEPKSKDQLINNLKYRNSESKTAQEKRFNQWFNNDKVLLNNKIKSGSFSNIKIKEIENKEFENTITWFREILDKEKRTFN